MATCYKFTPPKDTVSKTGSVVRELEETFSRVFAGTTLSAKRVVEVEGRAPTVCKSPKELGQAERLKLRTPLQTITSPNVELKQFDPNFFSHRNIWCRFPGCKQRRLRQNKFDGTKSQKEDLYLCSSHRNIVEGYVVKMCTEKGVSISTKSARAEDLKGYTSLIGLLESGYHSLTKPTTQSQLDSKHRAILQEVCLNVRNYLIIVNALLNPDWENLVTALTAPMTTLKQILEILRDSGPAILETLRGLVDVMRQVMEHILFAFGVIYSWVYLSLVSNPGAQLGAGIGGFIGLVGYGGGPLIGTLTAAGGGLFGGLIGSGLYNLWGPQEDHARHVRGYQEFAQAGNRAQGEAIPCQQQPGEEEHVVYYLTGSAAGDLALAIVCLYLAVPAM